MLRHLFSAAFLVLSVPVAAQAETLQQVKVSLGDLNLDRPAGQAIAQARIHAAAVRLCGTVRSIADLRGWASQRAFSDRDCVAQAVERANEQMANARMPAGSVGSN